MSVKYLYHLAEQEKLEKFTPKRKRFNLFLHLNWFIFTVTVPIHSNSTLQKYTTQYPPCIFLAWLPWDHPKLTGCSSEFKNLPFSPGQSWYSSAVGKKHTHSAKKTYNFQKLATVQNQHLTFALNSHHVLGWSNTFHNTLLIWCLYKKMPWDPSWSWQSSSLMMCNYLCVVLFSLGEGQQWNRRRGGEERFGLGWDGMGCCGITLSGQLTSEWKLMVLSAKTTFRRKGLQFPWS